MAFEADRFPGGVSRRNAPGRLCQAKVSAAEAGSSVKNESWRFGMAPFNPGQDVYLVVFSDGASEPNASVRSLIGRLSAAAPRRAEHAAVPEKLRPEQLRSFDDGKASLQLLPRSRDAAVEGVGRSSTRFGELAGRRRSALEISHRCPWFDKVLEETEANLRTLLKLPANYRGAVPPRRQPAAVRYGANESYPGRQIGRLHRHRFVEQDGASTRRRSSARPGVYDSKATNYDRLPAKGEATVDPAAAFAYFTSNETIQGVQFLDEPASGGVPLVWRCFERFHVPAAADREVRRSSTHAPRRTAARPA